jgi:hypothetical protein
MTDAFEIADTNVASLAPHFQFSIRHKPSSLRDPIKGLNDAARTLLDKMFENIIPVTTTIINN